jgi:ABC-type amino acid transport substrate-binding protein
MRGESDEGGLGVNCQHWLLRIIGIALLCSSNGILAAGPSSRIGSDPAQPKIGVPDKVLRIGLESDSKPIYFVNESGQIDGLDYRIGKAVAEKLGIPEVAFVEDHYDQLPELLKAGEVDIIMGGYVPDDSIEGVLWSKSYLDFGLCMIVRQDSFLRNYKQLRNRKVAIYDDPAAERWVLDNIPGVEVKKFLASSGWFEAVQRREVAALIYDYPFAASEIKRYPGTRIVQFNLNESHYAIGVAEANPILSTRIDGALSDILTSPDYERWLGAYLAYTPAPAVAAWVVEDDPPLAKPESAAQHDEFPSDNAEPVVEKAEDPLETTEPLEATAEPEPPTGSATLEQTAVVEGEATPEHAANEPSPSVQRSYVVKVGDSLARIARKELDAMERWPEIWELNKAVLANPHDLVVGSTLKLPR